MPHPLLCPIFGKLINSFECYLLLAFPSCLTSLGSSLPPPVWFPDPNSTASAVAAAGHGALTNYRTLYSVREMLISGTPWIISLLPVALHSRHYLKNVVILAKYKWNVFVDLSLGILQTSMCSYEEVILYRNNSNAYMMKRSKTFFLSIWKLIQHLFANHGCTPGTLLGASDLTMKRMTQFLVSQNI